MAAFCQLLLKEYFIVCCC